MKFKQKLWPYQLRAIKSVRKFYDFNPAPRVVPDKKKYSRQAFKTLAD